MRFLSIGEVMIEMSAGGPASGEAAGYGSNWRMGFAGDTLNTLWYVRAALDPARDTAAYLTALGDDRFSGRIAAFLGENGIDTASIVRIEGKRPGLYMIEQVEGDRRFTYWRETSAARRLAEDRSQLAAAIGQADCIYLSGITLAILPAEDRTALIDLCGRAREAGKTVAFDPNIRPALWTDREEAKAAITAMAEASTLILPSFDDEAAAFGDESPDVTVARYAAAGVPEIAVKNGAGTILYRSPEGSGSLDAIAGVESVDPTGAGDSFNGAYLGARLTGGSVSEAVAAGRDMAARVVGIHGALADFADPDGRWAGRTSSP